MNLKTLSFIGILAASLWIAWIYPDPFMRALAQEKNSSKAGAKLRKPSMADTIRANIYADNWFMLYINGELAAVDSIRFIPHNVISVDLLPSYPMTIAVMARDNADPETGMEYANTNIGDGGFILKFADGTVTDGSWKAKAFSSGPIGAIRESLGSKIRQSPINGLKLISMTVHGQVLRNTAKRRSNPNNPITRAISRAPSSYGQAMLSSTI